MTKRHVGLASAIALALTLVGCSASEKIDPAQARTDCGIMVKLISGAVTPSPENLEQLETVVSGLATTSYGPIRNVAEILLPSFSGSGAKQVSQKDSEKAIEELKNFCMDYVVD